MTQVNTSSAARAVRVGVVGYGWWGKTIARHLAQSARLEWAAVAEADPGIRAGIANELGTDALKGQAPRVYDSFDALLTCPDLDAVILCTPHQQHADQIVAAASAGKHVFCEKPLCLTLADAQRAVACCVQNQRVLGIGHERRFEPAVIALREAIASGQLGTILQIEGNFNQNKFLDLPRDNWRLSKTYAPVGPLTATGIHLVDLSIAVLGPAQAVWARLATRGSDFENGDTLAIMLAFENGANALVSAVLATPFDGRFAVYGSFGWCEIRDRTHPENPTGWDITTTLKGQAPVKTFAPPHPAVRDNLEAFARAICGEAPYPVSHTEMLANVSAVEAIMKSVDSKALEWIAAPSLG